MLEARNLSFVYGAGTPFEKKALDDVSFAVQPGQFMGVIGHTGSGKSTMIQHLNGLLKPHAGQVLLDGRDIWGRESKIRDVRFRVGLVFQYPEYQLFEETVERDIAFGPRAMGLGEEEVRERVAEAMQFVQLRPELAAKSPFELSGGQKRRVAIAGVIAMRPNYLVLDEPTAGLDPAGRQKILAQLRDYQRSTGAGLVLVTHSMEDIARTVDSVTVMARGRVHMTGALDEVFSQRQPLVDIGLDVPAVSRILLGLEARGLELGGFAYTPEAARELLLAYKEARHA